MAIDNSPRERQISKLKRKDAQYFPYERILIVCEGEKTEPNYFKDIRRHHRISSAVVVVIPSEFGTCPKKIVEYAYKLLIYGNYQIKPNSFDQVYAVFDRDQHEYYNEALTLAKRYQEELRDKQIIFRAIPSIPCFEIWYLLHHEYIEHRINRTDVYKKLKQSMPYSKGELGYYTKLLNRLKHAKTSAMKLKKLYKPDNGLDPYTDIDILVELLENVKKQ